KDSNGLKAIDRQEVILDIFVSRANTREAVLQSNSRNSSRCCRA
ncbi:hypothetical protein EMGBS10_09260, partial [Opitutia bacterium]